MSSREMRRLMARSVREVTAQPMAMIVRKRDAISVAAT